MRLYRPQNLGHPIKAYSGALNTGTLVLHLKSESKCLCMGWVLNTIYTCLTIYNCFIIYIVYEI